MDTKHDAIPPVTVAVAKLRRVCATPVAIPVIYPIASSVRRADRVINIIVALETDAGITGWAYLAAFSPGQAHAVRTVLEELSAQLVGHDVLATGELWDRARRLLRLGGLGGLATFALSGLDMAAWDVLGQACHAPIHRLLGTRRTVMPAYASDGCWLSDDPRQTAQEAATFAAAGFRGVKVRLGRPCAATDLATLDAIREAAGGLDLHVDVNQGWDRATAAHMSPLLATRDIRWLEEPLPAEDIDGLSDLRQRSSLQIVSGENSYLPDGLRRLVDAQAVSMLMPDVQRVGGVTGWVRAAAYAEVCHVPITAHLFPEISVHLLAAAADAGPLEWVTWLHPLLEEPPVIVTDGRVQVPEQPGWGLRFARDAIDFHRIEK